MATPAHPFEVTNETDIEIRHVPVNLASQAWALHLIRSFSEAVAERVNVPLNPTDTDFSDPPRHIATLSLHGYETTVLVYPPSDPETTSFSNVFVVRHLPNGGAEMATDNRHVFGLRLSRLPDDGAPVLEACTRTGCYSIVRDPNPRFEPLARWWGYPVSNPLYRTQALGLLGQLIPTLPGSRSHDEWSVLAVLMGRSAHYWPDHSNEYLLTSPTVGTEEPYIYYLEEDGSDIGLVGQFRGSATIVDGRSKNGIYPDITICNDEGARCRVMQHGGPEVGYQAEQVLEEHEEQLEQARARERQQALAAQQQQRQLQSQRRATQPDLNSPAFLLDSIGVQSRPRAPQFSLFGLSLQGGIVPFMPLLPIALAVFILGRGSTFKPGVPDQNPAQASPEALALQAANPKLLNVERMSHTRWGTALFVVLGTLMGVTIAAFMTALALAPVTLFLTPAIFIMAFLAMLVLVVLAPATQAIMRAGPNSSPTGFVPLSDAHALVQDIHAMCDRLGIRRVRHIGYYQSSSLNAYAQGTNPDHFTMAFSEGLLQTLQKDEILAVAGHELGHMLNNDMRMMQTGISIQKSLTWFLIFNRVKKLARVLFTTASEAALMKLSRSREFWADAVGAALTSPQSMANALRTLESGGTQQEPHPGTARIGYAMIYQQGFDGLRGLFATHPPISHRIAAIEASTYLNKLPYASPENASDVDTAPLHGLGDTLPVSPARPV